MTESKELSKEDLALLQAPQDQLAFLDELLQQLEEARIKVPVDPKVARTLEKLKRLKRIVPRDVEAALKHQDYNALTSIGNMLGYTPSARSEYTRIFLVKMLNLAKESPNAQRLLSRFKTAGQASGVNLTIVSNVEVLRKYMKDLSFKVNDTAMQAAVVKEAFRTAMKGVKVNLPFQTRIKEVTLETGEKEYKLLNLQKPVRKPRFHPRFLITTSEANANVAFEYQHDMTEWSDVKRQSWIRFQADFAEKVSTTYVGPGTMSGSLKRAALVYKAYEWSQSKKEELRKRIEAGDQNASYPYSEYTTSVRYFEASGLPRKPDWIANLPNNPSEWFSYFEESGIRYNYPNPMSDAGPPYMGAKKGQCLINMLSHVDALAEDCQTMGWKALMTRWPGVDVVDVKPKAEAYKLRQEFDITRPDPPDITKWIQANLHQEKVRSIYNPSMWATMIGVLFSAVFKSSISWRTLPQLVSKLQNTDMFLLKNFPYVGGTFDSLVRRICLSGQYAGSPTFFKMIYSDNAYILRKWTTSRMVDPSILVISPAHPDFQKWNDRIGEAIENNTLVDIQGERALDSIDGAKMESATDRQDAKDNLIHLCNYLGFRLPALQFIMKVGLSAVAGGRGVVGNTGMRIPWGQSGSFLTFYNNDFKLFPLIDDMKEEDTVETLFEELADVGIKMTVERVVLLGPPGTPLAVDETPTHIDLLGFAVSYMKEYGIYVPVLERTRMIGALMAVKRGDRQTLAAEIAKLVSLYIYGCWADEGQSLFVLTRLKQIKNTKRAPQQLTTEVAEDLPPLSQDIVDAINEASYWKLDRAIVARIFDSKFVPLSGMTSRGDYEHSSWTPLSKRAKMVEPDLHTLYDEKNRTVLSRKMSNALSSRDLTFPVVSTTMTASGRIKEFTLSNKPKDWKEVLKLMGASQKVLPVIKEAALISLHSNPQLSSRSDQDVERSRALSAAHHKEQQARTKEVRAEREKRKAEKKAKKLSKGKARDTGEHPPNRKETPTINVWDLKLKLIDDISKVEIGKEKTFLRNLFNLMRRTPSVSGPTDGEGSKLGRRLAHHIGSLSKKQKVLAFLPHLGKSKPAKTLNLKTIAIYRKAPQVGGEISQKSVGMWFTTAILHTLRFMGAIVLKHKGKYYMQANHPIPYELALKWLTGIEKE